MTNKKQSFQTSQLPSRERVTAIAWAANQAEISYGKFVHSLSNAKRMKIYANYQHYLEEKERAEQDRIKNGGKAKLDARQAEIHAKVTKK